MWGNKENKVPKYLFGAFCFYLLYFAFIILYLKTGMQWLFVPVSGFVLGLFVMKFYDNQIKVQAYVVSVLTCINIVAYSLIFHEFTEVFTVFSVAVCLLSFYDIPEVNYLVLGFCTVYTVYELIWQNEWRNLLRQDISIVIRIFSVYLLQFLLIMLIKKQRMMKDLIEHKAREAEEAVRAKEDFLVNMSHELRTPLNVITGMAELALRNELPADQEKKYLYNIRAAGEELLSVVDDILDITKIDSGNLKITEEEYEIVPIIRDLDNVIQVILGEKQVVLLVDINPDIPVRLRGDGVHVKQILFNLLNNAVKNTEKGTIHLKVDSLPVEGEHNRIDLRVSVEDTGTGMTKEQLDDLFAKFKQGDSERIRFRGESGLGLTLSGRLIELMGGRLSVDSEVGRGSKFMFTIRQQVTDPRPCGEMEPQMMHQIPFQRKGSEEEKNSKKEDRVAAFTAPSVRILLVDDNKVNLKVAEGLLRPYKMCIEKADSGRRAVEMVRNRIYDLIFMDYMMPEMDGVEAAGMIRKIDGEYFRTVPIIALSANAARGAKEMFLRAGLNDFVAKPIEMSMLDQALRRWLPEDKIVFNHDIAESLEKETSIPDVKVNTLLWQMEGVDVVAGMRYSGEDADLYREILTDYMDAIEEKAAVIEEAVRQGDIETYTIEVHSLKSTSKSIGAMELSALARDLEENGKNSEWGPIIARTPALLSMYRELYHVIMPYRAVKEKELQEKRPVEDHELMEYLEQLSDSINLYDSIRAEEIIEELSGYAMENRWCEHMQAVSEAMGRFDYDICMERVALWRRQLQEKMQEAADN